MENILGKFKEPEINIEQHIEIRKRRLFPISFEMELQKSFQERLDLFAKQIEAERKYWEAYSQIQALTNRIVLFDTFKQILNDVFHQLKAGNIKEASTTLENLLKELDKQELIERQMLTEKSTKSNISAPVPEYRPVSIVYTSTSSTSTSSTSSIPSYTPATSTTTSSTTRTTTTSQTPTTQQPKREEYIIYRSTNGGYVKEIREGNNVYWEAYNPYYGGITAISREAAINWANQSLFSVPSTKFNPFG